MTGRDGSRDDVGAYFDASSAAYDSAYGSGGGQGRVLRRRAEVAAALLGEKRGDVLDAGMGGGVLLVELDRCGWRVSGIDIAPAMVERARERLPDARDRLLEASIDELPFEDESFDAVVATGVLEYTAPDLDRSVGELVRVLRPLGCLVASFPNYGAPATLWRAHVHYPLVRLVKRHVASRRPPPPRMPTVPFSDFLSVLERSGLRVEVVEPVGVRPAPKRLADRVEHGKSALAHRLAVQKVVRARKVAQ
jgi:SAM-dependent methyltransferase